LVLASSLCSKIGTFRPAYINYNFPINPPSLSPGNIPAVFSPGIKNPLSTLDIPPDTKELILLFGRLAEEVYPETLEQGAVNGEGYSWKIIGEPQSIVGRINRQNKALPKWTKIFRNPASVKIARFQFQARLSRLPFKWPIWDNQTAVESTAYNLLIEQNSQSFDTVRMDPSSLEGWLQQVSGGDRVVAANLLKSIGEYERLGHTFGVLRKIKQINRSTTRAFLHKLSMNEEISPRVFDAFFDSVLGKGKIYFSLEEFSGGIGIWKGPISDGEIDFETFSCEVGKHLGHQRSSTAKPASKSIRNIIGGILGLFGRRNQTELEA